LSSAHNESRTVSDRVETGNRGRSARNALEHFSVGGEFFHKHQQPLNSFFWFVSGQAAPNEIDFLQFPRLQEQLFTPRAREKYIHRRIDSLVADFPVEHHFHVSGALELLKDQFVHATAGFDQCRSDNRQRTGFLSITRGGKNLPWNFHGARIDTTAHGSAPAAHCIIERASCTRDGIEEDTYMFCLFAQ